MIGDVGVVEGDVVAGVRRIGIGFLVVDGVEGDVTGVDVEDAAGRHRTGIHRDHIVRAVGSDRGVAATCGDADAVIASIAGDHAQAAAEVGGADVADQIVDHLIRAAAQGQGDVFGVYSKLPRQSLHRLLKLREPRIHQRLALAQRHCACGDLSTAELLQNADEILISANPAAPQVDLLDAPAAKQFGPLQQTRAIDATTEGDLAGCAVGNQVQFFAGVSLQPGRDGCNGVLARLHRQQPFPTQGLFELSAVRQIACQHHASILGSTDHWWQ